MSEEVAWTPGEYYREESNIAQFVQEYQYDSYKDLVPTDERELKRVWGDISDDIGMIWRTQYSDVADCSEGPAFAEWYPDGRLNAVETMLDQWAEETPETPIYEWVDETSACETVTFAEAQERANRLANALRAHGIEKGDTVGLLFPMHPTGFIAALACLRIGAVFTMIFPGYGAEAVGHRLADAEADLVITADGYRRGGEPTDLLAKIKTALDSIDRQPDVVVYEHLDTESHIEGADSLTLESFAKGHSTETETTVVDSNHPAMIAYSSGTTGAPKGTIHTHASLLVMGNKEAKFHFDISQGETLMWVTDYGWLTSSRA